jgi:hypothetical protein
MSALLVLLAAPAFAAERVYVQGEPPVVTLFEIKGAEATTTDKCLETTESASTLDAAACEDFVHNYVYATRAMQVTNLRVVVGLAGDSTYVCVFNIEVAGAEPTGSVALTTTASAVAGTVKDVKQNFVIAKGAKFGIHVENGVKCGTDGTLKPSFAVQLEGHFLDTPGITNVFTPSAK